MASATPSPRRLISSGAIALALSGCDLLSGVPAGTLVGGVHFDGRPAAGISVGLQSTGTDGKWVDVGTSAITDAAGAYRFERLKPGTYRATYSIGRDRVLVGGVKIGPSQVSTWYTPSVSIGGGGMRFPAFDVAYNGLIYPESGKSNAYSAAQPLPFHWATHRDGSSYRVKLYDIAGGSQRMVWQSDWTQQPLTVMSYALQKGNYRWEVEIDGGGTGKGTSEPRNVDLDYQSPDSPSAE